MNVNYANAKLLRTKVAFQTQIESFSSLVSSDMLNLMMHIVNECTFPCLSLKSGWFTEETETRILFEMPYDVNQNIPKRFEHQGLLKYIEFL